MADTRYLDWPFFDAPHRELARVLDAWATANVAHGSDDDVDAVCRTLVKALGDAGWLRYAVASNGAFDTRAICLIRETLARYGLAVGPVVNCLPTREEGARARVPRRMAEDEQPPGTCGGRSEEAFVIRIAADHPVQYDDVGRLDRVRVGGDVVQPALHAPFVDPGLAQERTRVGVVCRG